jgi:hypothetical protein
MNERIDKLIEQCTRQNFSDCVGGYETFDKEKFAELIVAECIDAALEAQADYYVINNMKSRLGVEE